MKEELSNHGLKITSSHIGIEELESNIEKVIADNKFLGNKYVVCPYLVEERRTEEGYANLIKSLKVVDEKFAAERITLLYHNHDFELENMVGDQCTLGSILASGYVDAEFNVFLVNVCWPKTS